MQSIGLASKYIDSAGERRTLFRLAVGAACLGIAASLLLTIVWFVSPLTEYPEPFDHAGDYLFTGNGIPFGLAPLALLWSLRGLHPEPHGRKVTIGVALAAVSLMVIMGMCTGSVIAGEELRWGPAYPLATLGSIVGVVLCCAEWTRARLLPPWTLWFWAFGWTVGGMLGPKGSQLLLAAAYAVLLVHLRRRATEEPRRSPSWNHVP